jgi:hypothetical protein
MSVPQTIAQQVGTIIYDTRLDYENDANPTTYSTMMVRISGTSGMYSFLVPSANLAGINNNAPVTLTLTQGPGVFSTAVAV